MVAAAYTLGGWPSVGRPEPTLVLWGSAAAAVIAALVVLTDHWSAAGWLAVGYIVFAARVGSAAPAIPPLLLLLALAFTPVLPRPRRSLALGVVIGGLTATLLWLAFDRFVR